MKQKIFKFTVLLCILLFSIDVSAQCPIVNNSFKAGENLTYDLYFKYGLINTKAGESTITIQDSKYKGDKSYKMTMIAISSGFASKMFSLNDTITSYMSYDIVPLFFEKKAHEGGDFTDETLTYSYSDGKVTAVANRVKNGDHKFNEKLTSTKCIYDMLSVLFYARTLDFGKMKTGDIASINFISGKKMRAMDIKLDGEVTIKASNKKKYKCHKLVLNINDPAFEDKSEAMTVYLSKDENRIPIRIDSQLKVGSTRVILKNDIGLKH